MKSRTDIVFDPERSWQNFNQALLPILIEPISQVVTFGSLCITKGRVTHFFNNNSISKRFQIFNHLFDWMVPLNYSLLGFAVENNFTDVFGEEYLEIFRYKEYNALFNAKYQFIYNHAFDGFDNIVSHRNPETLLTQELFHKFYYLIDKKFKHLVQKSKEAIHTDKKTLYLVYGDATDYICKGKGQRQEDFIAFTNSIKKQRNNNFLVLVLVTEKLSTINNYIFDTIIENNLIIHQIKFYPHMHWDHKDSIAQWNKILKVFA